MTTASTDIVYPICDGEPMADNVKQARWMLMLYGNLDALLDCFVGMNNFWFPRENEPEIRLAPDVYVAFGRPKGDRDSYKQWEEQNTPVTVVFEIWSPGNNTGDMEAKYTFYTDYGVEEYYIYDPYRTKLEVYLRHRTALRRVWNTDGFVSPRMGIKFDLSSAAELTVWRPDGRPFKMHAELEQDLKLAEARIMTAETARASAEAARASAEARAARLVELVRKARQGQAMPEELAELERLEEGTA